MSVRNRLAHAWNAFTNLDKERLTAYDYGAAYGGRPDRIRLTSTNERSIISSIYNRLALDVAAVPIRHVRLDPDGRYLEDIKSGLNNCLTVEANIDQAARALRQDIATTLFDRGVAAIVPVDTSIDPKNSSSFEIQTLRVAEITQWMPRHVKVALYNEAVGRREEIILEKRFVAVVENPFYAVMNEPNSTLQRLIRNLNLLDSSNEAASSAKLDMIIQLPYVIKSEARKQQAEQRRADIEFQLKGSKYGIAYTDGTEKITQLNRPVENTLLSQIQFLKDTLYEQLGITKGILDETADEKTMLNYNNRTIEPVVTAIVEALHRTFLTKTARSQGQAIMYFRDPFKLVPMAELAQAADLLGRNEIVTANEFRQIMGMRPVLDDPKADQLRNSNMPQSELGQEPVQVVSTRADAPAIE